MRYPKWTVNAAIKAIQAHRRANGRVPVKWLSEYSEVSGVPVATLRSWKDKQPLPEKSKQTPPKPLGQRELAEIARHCEMKAAWKRLNKSGVFEESYSTFLRRAKNTDKVLVTCALKGIKEAMRDRVYLIDEAPHRNAVWFIDETEEDLRVIPDRGTKPYRQHKIIVGDARTRVVFACHLLNSAAKTVDILAIIAEAGLGFDVDGTFVGGLPDQIVWDNAKAHLAEPVTQALTRLAIASGPIERFASYQNGKAERFIGLSSHEVFQDKPGYLGGGQTSNGRLRWDEKDPNYLITAAQSRQAMAAWLGYYNFERRHSSLAGRTPFQAWEADRTALRTVSEEDLFDMLRIAPQARTINKAGVRFRDHDYLGPSIADRAKGTRRVQVRYLPTRHDVIWIFTEDGTQFIGRLDNQRAMPDTTARAILARRALQTAA